MSGNNVYESGGSFRQVIRNFSAGLIEDKRLQVPAGYSITKHFDAFTYSTKLVPYPKRVTANGLSGGVVTSLKLTRFLYAPNQTTQFWLYGLGADGSGFIKLYRLNIDGTSNLDNENWVACTNGESSSGARSEKVLFYYKNYLYMYQGSTGIARFDTTEVASFTDTWQTIDDSTGSVQPIRHPNDDIAYFFGKNNVYSLNGTSWNGAVLTLPTDQTIVARAAFGNYLAIACTSTGNLDKKSYVYLWDRDSSLTTLTQRIDFGEGTILHLANLQNKLIAVMSFYPNNLFSLGRGKVFVKTPTGDFATILNELEIDVSTQTTADFPSDNVVRGNKLYFAMKATLNGDPRVGIWVVDQNGRMTIDQFEPGLTVNPNASAIKGLYPTANIWWIAYDDGSGGVGAYSVTRTDVDGNYDTTNPCIYETLKLSTVFITGRGTVIENNNTTKKLTGVTLHTEPLPAAGQVTMKYRCDGATTWNTIFVFTGVGGTQHQAINIENAATEILAAFPQYSEIEFRLESIGGASIVGIEYSGEIVDNNIY